MRTIRTLVILAVISIIGIVLTQIYWVSKALDINEREFHQTISIALRSVAEKIARSNKSTVVDPNPVVRLSSSYYIVNSNEPIDANILEYYLRTELAMKQLDIDFEYGIYDCSSDSMVYGKYVSRSENKVKKISTNLPKLNEYSYYFGVRFPTKTMFLVNEIGIWIFLSAILLVVIVFFGYALLIILKQRRLSEIQKDFINNMTHEFKTPISTIAIAANVLSKDNILQSPDKLKNYVKIILNENDRLKNQVEKVLQMAKIDREKPEIVRENLDLHTLIEDVCMSFYPKLPPETSDVILELNAENHFINADKVHTMNVLANLFDNAVKYSKEKIYIKISTENRKKFVILQIEDAGIGIPQKHLNKIFERFFRVPTGNVHNVKGFGLGLNYVKNIAKVHNWRIFVKSEVGKGTSFILKIATN